MLTMPLARPFPSNHRRAEMPDTNELVSLACKPFDLRAGLSTRVPTISSSVILQEPRAIDTWLCQPFGWQGACDPCPRRAFLHGRPGISCSPTAIAGRIGVPNEHRFSAMRCKFQPRACIAARSFLLEGRSVSSLSSRTEPSASRSRNSQCGYRLATATPFPLGRRRRDAGSTPSSEYHRRVSVPATHSCMVSVHIERGIRVPIPSRVESSDNRVPSSSCRCHVQLSCGQASPEGVRTGRRIDEFRLDLVSVPVARVRPLLVSVRIHHVHSPVVKEQSKPRYR